MRTFSNLPATKGDVIEVRGTGTAPGAGGVISTVVVTDDAARGRVPGVGGYECRDATEGEIRAAIDSGKFSTVYSS